MLWTTIPDNQISRSHKKALKVDKYLINFLTVNIPDEWEIKSRNSCDSLAAQFGSATWNYSMDDKKLNIHIKSLLNGATVRPGQYRAFQDFIDQIKERNLREIVLQTKN